MFHTDTNQKKSKTLTAEEVNKFIKEAPDDKYLFEKVSFETIDETTLI